MSEIGNKCGCYYNDHARWYAPGESRPKIKDPEREYTERDRVPVQASEMLGQHTDLLRNVFGHFQPESQGARQA